MQEEHVTRVGFATRRTAQQQRHLTIRLRVLGEIIVNDQHIFARVHQLFAHRATGERGDPAQRGRFRRAHRNDRGVRHRAFLFQDLRERRNGRILLTDGDIDAKDVFAFLIDDRVDGDRRLTGRTVADD